MSAERIVLMVLLVLLLNMAYGYDNQKVTFIDDTPPKSFYPYRMSVVLKIEKLNKRENCVLWLEEHKCPNGDSVNLMFDNWGTNNNVEFVWSVIKAGKRVQRISYDIRGIANPDEYYQSKHISSLTVEITFHTILLLVDYKPAKEFILNNDEYGAHVGNIRDEGYSLLEKCREVVVHSGTCKRVPCQIYTGHRLLNFFKTFWNGKYLYPKWERCMDTWRQYCNQGFCHNGDCETTDFGDVCTCKGRGFLRHDWLGEYCSISRKEEVERLVRWSQAYEIEVDFHEDHVQLDIVPNFEDWSWSYYFVRFYEIAYDNDTVTQKFVYHVDGSYAGLATCSVRFEAALPNTTYLISTYGRSNLDRGDNDPLHQSFSHFTEIHTPGYTYLPAPTNLQIEPVTGNMFKLSWEYEHDIPAKEFLIKMKLPDGSVEEELTVDNSDRLALRSNTSYNITVSSLNSIGDSIYDSEPILYTTPVFKYARRSHGKYDFAKWFFKENTISVKDRFVYFKNPVRRDTRVERVVIMLNASLESRAGVPGNMSAVYHAARFEQSYDNHLPSSPYVTASFTTTPLPRRLLVGDRYFYEEYFNGALDKNFVYQTYVIVWYKSGNTIDVSIQYLNEIKLSKIPWVTIFVSISAGTLTLTIFSGLFNCCYYQLVLAHRRKKINMLRGSLSVKSLLVEDVYMNNILPDADYDMTKSAGEDGPSGSGGGSKIKHTFSLVG